METMRGPLLQALKLLMNCGLYTAAASSSSSSSESLLGLKSPCSSKQLAGSACSSSPAAQTIPPSSSSSNSSNGKGAGGSAAIFGGGREGHTSARMGLYGALSSCPLDVVKTRQVRIHLKFGPSAAAAAGVAVAVAGAMIAEGKQQQSVSGTQTSIRAAAAAIRRDYGLLGFWRGSVPLLLRVAPGTGFYFTTLGPMLGTWGTVAPLLQSLPLERITHTSLKFDPSVVPGWYLGLVSGVARGFAVAVFNPISIVKTRMESSLGRGGMLESFVQLLRREPPLNWFRGTLATVCRDMPFSGLFFVVYVHLKGQLGVEADSRERVSFYALQNFACGALAAGTASALTHPFDVLRTRLQLDGVAAAAATAAGGAAAAPSPAEATASAVAAAARAKAAAAAPPAASPPAAARAAASPPATSPAPAGAGAAARAAAGGGVRRGHFAPLRRGLIRGLADLARRDGLGVLWRGLGMRLVKRSLMAALTWTSFEEIKSAASHSPTPRANAA
ncbi:hypothetical protein Esti_004907 [Eimeria stiedai]